MSHESAFDRAVTSAVAALTERASEGDLAWNEAVIVHTAITALGPHNLLPITADYEDLARSASTLLDAALWTVQRRFSRSGRWQWEPVARAICAQLKKDGYLAYRSFAPRCAFAEYEQELCGAPASRYVVYRENDDKHAKYLCEYHEFDAALGPYEIQVDTAVPLQESYAEAPARHVPARTEHTPDDQRAADPWGPPPAVEPHLSTAISSGSIAAAAGYAALPPASPDDFAPLF